MAGKGHSCILKNQEASEHSLLLEFNEVIQSVHVLVTCHSNYNEKHMYYPFFSLLFLLVAIRVRNRTVKLTGGRGRKANSSCHVSHSVSNKVSFSRYLVSGYLNAYTKPLTCWEFNK